MTRVISPRRSGFACEKIENTIVDEIRVVPDNCSFFSNVIEQRDGEKVSTALISRSCYLPHWLRWTRFSFLGVSQLRFQTSRFERKGVGNVDYQKTSRCYFTAFQIQLTEEHGTAMREQSILVAVICCWSLRVPSTPSNAPSSYLPQHPETFARTLDHCCCCKRCKPWGSLLSPRTSGSMLLISSFIHQWNNRPTT